MKNLPCALMTSTAVVLIVLYGWSWWSVILFVCGCLMYEYTPKKYEDLVYRKLELECEMLEKDLKRKQCGMKKGD